VPARPHGRNPLVQILAGERVRSLLIWIVLREPFPRGLNNASVQVVDKSRAVRLRPTRLCGPAGTSERFSAPTFGQPRTVAETSYAGSARRREKFARESLSVGPARAIPALGRRALREQRESERETGYTYRFASGMDDGRRRRRARTSPRSHLPNARSRMSRDRRARQLSHDGAWPLTAERYGREIVILIEPVYVTSITKDSAASLTDAASVERNFSRKSVL